MKWSYGYFFWGKLWLVQRNITYLYMWILFPVTLLNWFLSFNSFFYSQIAEAYSKARVFSSYMRTMTCTSRDNFSSPSVSSAFWFFFSCLITLAGPFYTVLKGVAKVTLLALNQIKTIRIKAGQSKYKNICVDQWDSRQ